MIIKIKVIPRAKKELIKEEGGVLKVYVIAPPEDGRANEAVVKILAKHFDVAKNCVRIVKGETGRNKIVEIG
jgi:hypothetical protein